MTNINSLAKSKLTKAWAVNNSMSNEPTSTIEAIDQVVHILDANYEKTDLQAVFITNCTNLSPSQQEKLLEVLIEFEDLIDGTLCDWKTEHVSFELKEGARPNHGRPYPVPKVHKETLIKN